MLTEKNKYIKETAETIYGLTQDENIRRQCQARADFIRNQQFQQHRLDSLQKQLAEKMNNSISN